MKTIQTKPDCTLQFIACPRGAEKTVYTYPEGADPLRWKPIGRLSEITEEQAKELVKEMSNVSSTAGANTFMVYPSNNRELKLRPFVSSSSTSEPARYLKAIHSLYSAAESVGIEEKDFPNYLVIKL